MKKYLSKLIHVERFGGVLIWVTVDYSHEPDGRLHSQPSRRKSFGVCVINVWTSADSGEFQARSWQKDVLNKFGISWMSQRRRCMRWFSIDGLVVLIDIITAFFYPSPYLFTLFSLLNFIFSLSFVCLNGPSIWITLQITIPWLASSIIKLFSDMTTVFCSSICHLGFFFFQKIFK